MSLSTCVHMYYEGPEHQIEKATRQGFGLLHGLPFARQRDKPRRASMHAAASRSPSHALSPIGMMLWGCAAHTTSRGQSLDTNLHAAWQVQGGQVLMLFVTVQLSCTACTLPGSSGWTYTCMQPGRHKESHAVLTGRVPLGCTACTMSRRAWLGLARAPWDQSRLKLPELLETRPSTLQVKLRSHVS